MKLVHIILLLAGVSHADLSQKSASNAADVKFTNFQIAGLLPLSASQHANPAQVHIFTLQQLLNFVASW